MTTELYQQYRRTFEVTPFKGGFVAYDWGNLPQPLYVTWMAYSEMFKEFSREVANAINALTQYTHRLTAWRDLLAPMEVDEQLEASIEFVDPLATVAINLPYFIRSRFIFATAHLCHQANRAKQGDAWKDEFPLDEDVWFSTMDGHGGPWNRYNAFKSRLEKVGAKNYQNATLDFRNAYNHRFSPPIVMGISQVVQRSVDAASGAVSYGFGVVSALTLIHVVSLLEMQCQHCYRAFEAFQHLIGEHEASIRAHNTESLKDIELT